MEYLYQLDERLMTYRDRILEWLSDWMSIAQWQVNLLYILPLLTVPRILNVTGKMLDFSLLAMMIELLLYLIGGILDRVEIQRVGRLILLGISLGLTFASLFIYRHWPDLILYFLVVSFSYLTAITIDPPSGGGRKRKQALENIRTSWSDWVSITPVGSPA